MNRAFCSIILSIAILLTGHAPSVMAQPAEAVSEQAVWQCPGSGTQLTLRVRGEISLHRAFFEATKNELGSRAFEDAISHQLKFTQGFFVHAEKGEPRRVLRLASTPRIETVRVRNESYPLDLKMVPVEHPDVSIAHPYLKAALAAGKTGAQEPGLNIAYTAQIDVLSCSPGDVPNVKALQLDLPRDPFLAYWTVAAAKQRPISWHRSKFTINPCADAEYADIPDPYYYWYFWRPRAEGKDADGRAFSCKELMRNGREYRVTAAEVVSKSVLPTRPLDVTGLPTDRPLRVSAIFGVIDPKGGRLDYADILEKIEKAPKDKPLLQSLPYFPFNLSVDRGSYNLLRFLDRVRESVPEETWQTEVDRKRMSLSINGKLKKSGTAVRLRVYFGQTDVLTKTDPAYWQNLGDALAEDDVILYSGHSGLGENLKLANLSQAIGKSAEEIVASSPVKQIIGYFSCFSYSYFGDEVAALRAGQPVSRSTDLVRTASPFTTEKGHLAVLAALDGALSKRPFDSDDFVIVSSFNKIGKRGEQQR